MAALTEDIKTEIILQLAQFRGYSEVARWVTDEWGVKVDRFQVRTYDPTNPAFAGSPKWREIFHEARKNYLSAVEAVPIANKAYRLNELQKNYDRARQADNLVLANAILEQAAKEVGGALTNERNLNVDKKGGGFRELTPEERRMAVAEMIHEAMGRHNAIATEH